MSELTAVQKVSAALDANKTPAPGTFRDAFAELDALAASQWEALRELLILRGKFEVFATLGSVVREAERAQQHPAPLTRVPAASEPAMCGVCGRREARVWDEGHPYCKRCARDEGVIVTGKIT